MKISHLPKEFNFKKGAEEFPLMIVVSVTYVCNARCPHCPYTQSTIRKSYSGTPFIKEGIFKRIVDECGKYHAFIRLSGGGEPLLHPQMLDLIEYSKKAGARIGLITNGSLLVPRSVERLLAANTDVVEISVDAADKGTYSKIRVGLDFDRLLENVLYLVRRRNEDKRETKVVVSVINQKAIAGKLDDIVNYWKKIVDNVIVRKYLTWNILTGEESGDPTPYLSQRVPCPWPFERLNVDSRGDVKFCGYDIVGVTDFGNVLERSIQSIWKGRKFNAWRRLLLEGRYEEIDVCKSCPDWRYRSWNYNYYYMLKRAERVKGERIKGKIGPVRENVVFLGGDE